jgi:hypothetical protein
MLMFNMSYTTLSYTTNTDEKASQVTITPIGEDNDVLVTIIYNGNSQTVASGTSSADIPLPSAVNIITLVVSKVGNTGNKNYNTYNQ